MRHKFIYLILFVGIIGVAFYICFKSPKERPRVIIYKRPKTVDESDIHVEEMKKIFPSFPLELYTGKKVSPKYNNTCAKFPAKFDKLQYNNVNWQTLDTSEATFQIFGAYWDVRQGNKMAPTVRLLAMVNQVDFKVKTYCQLWFKKKVIVTTLTWKYYIWNKNWGTQNGTYQPYLISCKVPKEHKKDPPIAVSLVDAQCNTPTNILKIYDNRLDEKRDFGVCVKGLDFHGDISKRLVEWIELLRLLGTSKIFIYQFHVHDNTKRVLEYYEGQGLVEVTPLTLPGSLPNVPYLQHSFLRANPLSRKINEIVPYNDCLYKHMYEYKYIVLLDLDEVIVPVNGTWKDLMRNVQDEIGRTGKPKPSSYYVEDLIFFDKVSDERRVFYDIPNHFHILQRTYRAANFTKPGYNVKAFHDTDLVLTLHNNLPLTCVETCSPFAISTRDARLQHYKENCDEEIEDSCDELKKNLVFDDTVLRFKKDLISGSELTLSKLNL